ncbi:MAG TPA: hypothetical protein VGT60_10590 [Candidatus Limnocylindria bacterium]|nr:hypothetical protein [Candidatus Limnocylindria bacterium]
MAFFLRVVLRAVDVFGFLRAPVLLRAVVFFRPALLRPVLFRAVVLFRPVVFFVVLRPVVLRPVVLRAVVFFRPPPPRVVFLRPPPLVPLDAGIGAGGGGVPGSGDGQLDAGSGWDPDHVSPRLPCSIKDLHLVLRSET